jgi:hypothetical protein
MSEPTLCRGAIVTARHYLGVVWQLADGVPMVVPAECRSGQHRSDVNYANEPLLPAKGALRAGAMTAVRSKLTVIGHASEATIAALNLAIYREGRARQFEDRFSPSVSV